MSKLKITGIKAITQLKYLKGFEISYLSKSGKPHVWELVSREDLNRLEGEIFKGQVHTDGAMIFATNQEKNHVVLIKEYRVSAGKYLYVVPAGLIDEGEDVQTAAVREFKEETGLTLHVNQVSPPRYVSIGVVNERVNVVYGTYSGTPSNDFLSDNEDAEVVFVDVNMAKHILQHEDVPIRTALLLEHFFNLKNF